MGIIARLVNWIKVKTSYIDPASIEEIEIDYDPDPRSCSHENLFAKDIRVTQEDGMSMYVTVLIECPACQDMWRLQRVVGEITQITGGHERFMSPRELGLEVMEEGGRLTKTEVVDETMRILRENRANLRLPKDLRKKIRRKPRRKK